MSGILPHARSARCRRVPSRGRARLRASGRGRRARLSRQRCRPRDRHQRAPCVHRRDAGRADARLGRRGSLVLAALGHPGPRHRRARGMARRPLVDQLQALLGRGGQAAWCRAAARGDRAVSVPCGWPSRAAARHRRARLARRGRGDRLDSGSVPSRNRLRRSSRACARSRRGRARVGANDHRGRHRASRSRGLPRLRRPLPRGEERRARCRCRLPVSARSALGSDSRHDLHGCLRALRRAGTDLGGRSARRVADVSSRRSRARAAASRATRRRRP